MTDDIVLATGKNKDLINANSEKIKDHIGELHKYQLEEMSNFKFCHDAFLSSKREIDNKIQVVVNAERQQ